MTSVSRVRTGRGGRPPLRRGTAAHLLPALCTAVFVELGLRSTTLPRLAGMLGIGLVTSAESSRAGSAWRFLGPDDRAKYRAARRVLRLWPRQGSESCLRLALVAGFLLRRREPGLRIGTTRLGDRVIAHAWLTVGEHSLDPRSARYEPLTTPLGRS